MKWWLTTHYPHRSPSHPWNIYLRNQYRNQFGNRIQVGDQVAFYELKGKQGTGRKAVIGFGRVAGPLKENRNREGGKDEADKVWEWQFPCDDYEWRTLPHSAVCKIIRRKSAGALRLRGGLKELTKDQYEALRNSNS